MAAAPVQSPTTLLQLLSQLEDAACEDERQNQSLREISIDLQSRADIALEQLDQCRASFAANEESRDQLRGDIMNDQEGGTAVVSIEVKQEETPIPDASYAANLTIGSETCPYEGQRGPPPNPNLNPYRGRGRGMSPHPHQMLSAAWEHGNGYEQ
ncbi:unnamed protein product [Pleuronectes platessa]|uniref:Uncharacterized protein n=1 Tax=Pleuronectes platessa TaxID=8262 RepID=A0A9N7VMU4_PLEPL|nr:unnamed protein product [Pleuronectes platessa]